MTDNGRLLTGHCHCGALEYEVHDQPLSVHACHCTDCQAQSGSAFTLSMVLRDEQLHITNGQAETKTFQLNDRETQSHLCAICGSTVWLSSPAFPGILAIKAGTLDETADLKPVAHIWVKSAQPWITFPEDAAIFQAQPPLDELLALNQLS